MNSDVRLRTTGRSWAGWLLIPPALLCPWQVYLPQTFGSLSVLQLSLAPLALALLFEFFARPRFGFLPKSVPVLLLVLLTLGCAVSSLWSPDSALAVRTAVKISGILLVGVATFSASPRALKAVAVILIISASILAGLIVVSRIFPLLETGFIFTTFAAVTIDPDILVGLREGTVRVNILAEDRAGLVFTNANVASLFLGLVVLLGWVAGAPRLLLLGSLPFAVLGIVATGSKAGLLAMVVVAGASLAAAIHDRPTSTRVFVALLLALGLLGGLGLLFMSTDTLALGVAAGTSRFQIWSAALPVLAQHPLLGLGFGGWEIWTLEHFRYEGISVYYPPQNLILIAWAWMGLAGAGGAAAFALSALEVPARSWVMEGHRSGRLLTRKLALTLFFAWFVVQSMVTNAAFTDIRIGFPLGIALGLLENNVRSGSH